MKYLQKIGLSLAAFGLVLSLFGFAISFTVSKTARNKETVKTWLRGSGFYEEIGDGLIDQVKITSATEEVDAVNLNDPEIRAIVNQSFNPELFQNIAENVLDASFRWLEGRTEFVQFDVDLAQSKQQLIDGLGVYAIHRINTLPKCTAVQMGAMTAMTDPLTAQCQPVGFNTAVAQQEVKASIAKNLSFLPDNYTNQSLQQDRAGGSVLPEQARQVYQLAGWLPLLFLALGLLSATGVILLSSNRRKGLYKFGTGLAAVAISLGVLAIFLTNAPEILTKAMTPTPTGQGFNSIFVDLLSVAFSDIAKFMWWFAGIYLFIGLLVVLIARLVLQPKPLVHTPVDTNLGNEQPPLL